MATAGFGGGVSGAVRCNERSDRREECKRAVSDEKNVGIKVGIQDKSIPTPRAQVNVVRVAANIAANNGSFLFLKQG